MRALLQRVTTATVTEIHEGQTHTGEVLGHIGPGLLVLLGVAAHDTPTIVEALARKIVALRIFADADGKTNLSLKDVAGELLLVSQFTLYADTRKGNRPSFILAAPPSLANALYKQMQVALAAELGRAIPTGRFGAQMQIALTNDGPFTLMLDTDAP